MKALTSSSLFRIVSMVLFGIFYLPLAQGSNGNWNGATDSLWSTGSNWSTGTPPDTASTAFFLNAGNGNTTITVGSINLSQLNIDSSAVAAYAFVNGTITLPANNVTALTIGSTVTTNQAANIDFILGTATANTITIANNSPTALLTLGGNIAGGTGGAAGNKTLRFNGEGDMIFSGTLSDGGASSVTLDKMGTGQLTISSAQTYTGSTLLTDGKLKLDFSAAGAPTDNIIKSGNTVSMGSGSLVLKGAGGAANNTQTVVMTNGGYNAGSIVMDNNNGTGTTTLALSSTGLGSRGTYGTMNIDLSQGLGGGGSNVITTTASAATLGWATVKDAGGTGFAAYDGSNLVRLTGLTELGAADNASTTNFIVTGSGSTLNHNAGSWSANSLTLDTNGGTATLDIGGGIMTVTQRGLLLTGTQDATIQNGQVGGTGHEVIFHTMGSGTLKVAATVSGGSGYLIKDGTGTLELSGSNSYQGETKIYGGVVKISSAANLGDASSSSNKIKLHNATLESTGGTYDLGANRTISIGPNAIIMTSSGTLTVSGSITSTGLNWEVDGAGDTILSGAAVGLANTFVTKSGAGTLTLSTASFRSGLTIDQGAVVLSGTYNPDATSGDLVLNAGSFTQTSTGASSGNGFYRFVQNSGTSSWAGTSTFKGGFNQYGGTVNVTGNMSETNILVNNASASFNQSSTGMITGSGKTFTVSAGTSTLAGTNSYTGTTSVSGGTLLINGDNSAATGAVNIQASGQLGGTGTIGGVTSISGTLSPGNSPGTLTFASNLNINNGSTAIFEGGDLVIVNGTLDLNNDWTLQLTTGFQDGGMTTLFTYSILASSPDLAPTFDISGLGFTPSGSLSLTDTGSSIVLNGISVVPEPATWTLLTAAGMILLFMRRRWSSLNS